MLEARVLSYALLYMSYSAHGVCALESSSFNCVYMVCSNNRN